MGGKRTGKRLGRAAQEMGFQKLDGCLGAGKSENLNPNRSTQHPKNCNFLKTPPGFSNAARASNGASP